MERRVGQGPRLREDDFTVEVRLRRLGDGKYRVDVTGPPWLRPDGAARILVFGAVDMALTAAVKNGAEPDCAAAGRVVHAILEEVVSMIAEREPEWCVGDKDGEA